MRVVAGSARGRRLHGPASDVTRATGDKVREAVFNSLGSLGAVEGAIVLDLFAGTGACGIEALSRGAQSATFVERDRQAQAVIRANLVQTGFDDERSILIGGDVLDVLGRRDLLGDIGASLAFVDPPYAFDQWGELLAHLTATTVVVESDRPIDAPSNLVVHRLRRYGNTTVTILQRSDIAISAGPQS